jgi:hypothetical protein
VVIGRKLPEVFDRHVLIPVCRYRNDSLPAARNW